MSTGTDAPVAEPFRTVTINIGPQHPATHGTLRSVMEMDGERVVRCEPEIGFLHTGFEKLGEILNWNKYVTVTDRMNYLSPLCNNVGFCCAVEAYLGVELPPRGKHVRVALTELTRIGDHLLCVGLQAMDLGAFTIVLWTMRERETLLDIMEMVTGARLTTSYTRIGGVARDLPEGFDAAARAFLDGLPGALAEIERVLDRNRIWHDRTRGIGVLSADEALAYGVTGPLLRASGVPYDVRRAIPYLGYETYDFDVPTSNDGDVYARYRIRMEEIRQSIGIVRQAIDRMPGGPVNVEDPELVLPPKGQVYSEMEALIYHFKLIMSGHGIRPAAGEFYHATESPNGELGWYIVFSGADRAWRLRCRAPSFNNYTPYAKLAVGGRISDAISTLGSLNVIAGELDR